MRDLGTMLSELEQHEPSFDLVTEARRRAAQRPSQAASRWHAKAKRGVGLALTAVVAAGVLVILALAAHSRSSNPPAHSPNGGPNTPRQELVADAELISASLASNVTSAQRFRPPDPSEVVADPAWAAQARADRHRLSQSDPLYPIFDQIVTAQRLARVGKLASAERLILPAANQARQYAVDHPSQSPLQPPAWAVRFLALHERPAIESMERFVRHRHPSGYYDLSWTAYGFTDVQTPTQPVAPTYAHPLSWLRPGTRWHAINQLHLQIQPLVHGPNREKALALLKRLDAKISQALAASQ